LLWALEFLLFVYDASACVAQTVGDLFGWRTVAAEYVAHVDLGLFVSGNICKIPGEMKLKQQLKQAFTKTIHKKSV
jgi:hypothetical protein